ncbi:hypothetical protein EVB87_194 [Rhizobium phage RHph_N28_1]|nr:hypothetical protein EVB87_194 [Rhizobium phage RHph_N28_1]QIG74223.1 hypothetical protein EVC07_195 [Rhizobium phage RHph_N42]
MTEITRRGFLAAIAAIAAVDVLPKDLLAAPAEVQEETMFVARGLLREICEKVERIYGEQYGSIPGEDVWRQVTHSCTSELRSYHHDGRVADFVVVCNANNNPPEVVDQANVFTDLYLKLYQNGEMVRMTFCYATDGGLFVHILKGKNLS